MSTRIDVAVIGGGQAGLALAWHLERQGTRYVVLDAAERIGDAWRSRWDSLRLFTPARYNGLPGMRFPAEPDHLPTKDEVAQYLEDYARTHALRVLMSERVHTVRPMARGGFLVATSQQTLEAQHVVIATGPFQRPRVPAFAARLEVSSFHSSEYRNPSQIPDGPVLVVGGGNSGVQIAQELAHTHATWLAVGARLPRLPERILRRSIFHWLDVVGAMDVSVDTRPGRRLRHRDALIGGSPRRVARRHGVRLAPRLTSASGRTVTTADGRTKDFDCVIWATGFDSDYGYLHAPVFDADGRPVQRRGITRVPGLYFLGLPWQHTRGSALLGWVGRDAAFLAQRLPSPER